MVGQLPIPVYLDQTDYDGISSCPVCTFDTEDRLADVPNKPESNYLIMNYGEMVEVAFLDGSANFYSVSGYAKRCLGTCCALAENQLIAFFFLATFIIGGLEIISLLAYIVIRLVRLVLRSLVRYLYLLIKAIKRFCCCCSPKKYKKRSEADGDVENRPATPLIPESQQVNQLNAIAASYHASG